MKIILSMLVVLLAAQAVFAAGIQDIKLNDINDKPTSLKAYAGEVVLLVNVASKCGNTTQYAGWKPCTKIQGQGLVVIGVPSNDFGGQEPGSAEEIKHSAPPSIDVTFPAHGQNPCQRRRKNIPSMRR